MLIFGVEIALLHALLAHYTISITLHYVTYHVVYVLLIGLWIWTRDGFIRW